MYYVLCTMYFHPRRAQDRPKIAPREPKMVLPPTGLGGKILPSQFLRYLSLSCGPKIALLGLSEGQDSPNTAQDDCLELIIGVHVGSCWGMLAYLRYVEGKK